MDIPEGTFKAYADETIPRELLNYLNARSGDEEDSERPAKRQKKLVSLHEIPKDPEWSDPLILAQFTIFVDFQTENISADPIPVADLTQEAKQVRLVSYSHRRDRYDTGKIRNDGRKKDAKYSKRRLALGVAIDSCSTLAELAEIWIPCKIDDRVFKAVKAIAYHHIHASLKTTPLRVLTKLRYAPSAIQSRRFRLDTRLLFKNARSLTEASFDHTESEIIRLLFPSPSLYTNEDWSSQDFYSNVHIPSKEGAQAAEAAALDVDGLECKLYPFQRRTVRWMLEREGVDSSGRLLNVAGALSTTTSHGFIAIKSIAGREIYVNEWLGIATSDRSLIPGAGFKHVGGLLAEEMGLGKTVEVVALLLLHQRPIEDGAASSTFDDNLIPSRSTIIISPDSIQQQWKSEIEMHAPALQVMIYEGLSSSKQHEEEIIGELIEHDVILVSYYVLSKEIHYVDYGPTRSLRHEKQYRKRKSPLVMIEWWRCILDECQMIESGVSKAAQVANEIPRQNAWAVSGTPLKKNANDLHALLTFLRMEPYSYSWQLWRRLVENYKPVFSAMIGEIALRHSKEHVKAELALPPQKRFVITLPFTPIEEQHYANLFQEMCEDCDLSLEGVPISNDWHPDRYMERMRTWLSRLRQTVLHPEVGDRNRKALGSSEGPLRTVAEVLQVMTEQNETTTRTEERIYLASKLRRGQILEHARKTKEALEIWNEVYEQSKRIVDECRREQAFHADSLDNNVGLKELVAKKDAQNHPSNEESNTRAGAWRLRLRASLEILHMATFFIANGHYQLKTNKETTDPQSEEFKYLEKVETQLYDDAKIIRKEILADTLGRADELMKLIRSRKLVDIPRCKGPGIQGGIETRHVIERSEDLCDALSKQAEQIMDWRSTIVKSLLLPLIDQEETELQGDEYETSTKQQDEVYVYMEVLRAMEADRHDSLTGQENVLIKHEMAVNLRNAEAGQGHAPELMIRLLQQRENLKPKKVLGSFRSCIGELRSLRSNLERQQSARSEAEIKIVELALSNLQRDFELQTRTMTELEKEIDVFMSSSNSRLDFYRQLQIISDGVAPFEEEFEDEKRNQRLLEMQAAEAKIQAKIVTLRSRARYLSHLNRENTTQKEAKSCIICQDSIVVGVLTSCGHQFCKECLKHWWSAHRTCPICKAKLQRSNFYQISYKPQEVRIQEESNSRAPNGTSSASSSGSTSDAESSHGMPLIYSGISKQTFAQIANIDVPGASFGTKIDTLARHVLYLRQSDPGAKSIIFSQFRDFLDILAKAFRRFKIAFVSVYDKQSGPRERGASNANSGIEQFKRNASIECFFLHAKAQAAGLNLVNATHVFLCEPLINTALELQAIARVHRIGQHRPTTVYMYLVDGTVEQAIYEIGLQRRLEYVGRVAHRESVQKKVQSPDELNVPSSPTALPPNGDLLQPISSEDDNGKRSTSSANLLSEQKSSTEGMQEQIESAESTHLRESSVARLLAAGRGGGELVPQADVWACLFRSRGAVTGRTNDAGNMLSELVGSEDGTAQRTASGFLGAEAASRRIVQR